MTMAQAAMMDPTMFFKRRHDNLDKKGYKPYVCHAAAVHWALRVLGKTDPQAEELIAALIVKKEKEAKQPLYDPWQFYGTLFASKAGFTPVTNEAAPRVCQAGDVIILDPPIKPCHSMVAVKVDAGKVGVRGFNNFGTFAKNSAEDLPIPMSGQYDPVHRDLSTRDPENVPMFRVPGGAFAQAVRQTFIAECKAKF